MKAQPRGNDLGSNNIIDLTLEDSDIQVIVPLANASQSQAKGNDQNQESKKRKQEAKGSGEQLICPYPAFKDFEVGFQPKYLGFNN
jgi:hypothetical protein